MPNHVTHRVVVTGKQATLKKFRTTYIVNRGDGEGEHLDFNLLIPMPKALKGTTSGSSQHVGLDVWYGDDEAWKKYLDYPWVKAKGAVTTREQLQKVILEWDPSAKDEADKAKHNIKTYGYSDWYEWSIHNWGTKWNSYSFRWIDAEKERLEFKFDTAWSCPIPVLEKLGEAMPSLKFEIWAFDEGSMFAARGSFEGGFGDIEIVDATDDMYQLVYGMAPNNGEGED